MNFYEFRTKPKVKCDDNGIELRIADRFYPSSKICHCCGSIKKDLKLSDSEVKAKISKRLTEFDGRYNAVINVDKGDTL